MLHWSHTVSLRASSTLVRAAHSFFFAVVRDNLQCIYRWEKDPYGKSFCIWTEGANGAHSLAFFFPETPQTPSSRKCPFVCYWRKPFGPHKFHPGSTSWYSQLRLRSWRGAEELHEEHSQCVLNHSTLSLGKLYHWGLGFSPGARAQPKHYQTPLTQPWVTVPAVPSLSSCWEQQLLTDLCQPLLILCQISIALTPNLLAALA